MKYITHTIARATLAAAAVLLSVAVTSATDPASVAVQPVASTAKVDAAVKNPPTGEDTTHCGTDREGCIRMMELDRKAGYIVGDLYAKDNGGSISYSYYWASPGTNSARGSTGSNKVQ